MKKANHMLPIGARVVVQDTHKGVVAGYGFISEAVTPYGNGQDVATRSYYLVRLDEWIGSGKDGGLVVSVIVAHPDNVKEGMRSSYE